MNKYNGLSKYKQQKIMRCFCADVTATQAALLLSMNRKTINRYYAEFRKRIYAYQCAEKDTICGVVEVDESYFGATRPRRLAGAGKLKRERATLKQPVFGIFERDGRVYTEIMPDCSKPTLQSIIGGKVALESEIVSDG